MSQFCHKRLLYIWSIHHIIATISDTYVLYLLSLELPESESHSYRLNDVLNEEGRGAQVVDVAVEEAEALLGEEVDSDDVVEAALDQHLGDQLHRDVAATPHLGCGKQG